MRTSLVIATTAALMAGLVMHSADAFLRPMPLAMRVSGSSNTQRGKSVGIINSMRENINSGVPNPNQIMLSNLPFDTTMEELTAFASQAGEVANVKIIVDRETGRSKGYGFVLYTEPIAATYALERLDGQELGGRPLKIRPAMRKTYGGGGGGGNWNRGGDSEE